MGRHAAHTQELEDEILIRLAHGEPLTKICRDEHMPAESTIFNWETIIPGFSEKVTRAREWSADHFSHEIIEIAEENPKATIDGDGWVKTCTDPAGIQRNKLRIDTRIKLMQMLKRKSYADKIPGDSPENPLHLKIDREAALAKLIGDRTDSPAAEPAK